MAPAQHHARKAYILRHHDVPGLQALDDGEVGAVGPHAHLERADPETPPGIRGRAGVVAADMAREVLRGIARDDHRHMPAAGHRQGVTRHGTRVGIDEKRSGARRDGLVLVCIKQQEGIP